MGTSHYKFKYANFLIFKFYSLLWETLTGREHLLFYGRLKNLKGAALTQVSWHALASIQQFSHSFALVLRTSFKRCNYTFDVMQAVEESLKSVNLFHGGVADKQAGKYSGGMKRRLSVAISLIGDPKVSLNTYAIAIKLFLSTKIF